MKEKIDKKLIELVEYILSKPIEAVTKEDYEVITAERRRLVYEADSAESKKKMQELLFSTMSTSAIGSY